MWTEVFWHSSIVLDKADMSIQKRRVISLFEAGNASLAREELPRIFPQQLEVDLRTSYETAVYAFALQHHPSLEKLHLFNWQTGSVNLQLLLDALSHHPTARELSVRCMTAREMAVEGECGEKALVTWGTWESVQSVYTIWMMCSPHWCCYCLVYSYSKYIIMQSHWAPPVAVWQGWPRMHTDAQIQPHAHGHTDRHTSFRKERNRLSRYIHVILIPIMPAL